MLEKWKTDAVSLAASLARNPICVLLLLGAAGCATTSPEGTFRDTAALVAERGVPAPVWARDARAEEDAVRFARETLAQPLDEERAVAIALRLNPHLQATLERLGIAQADFAQATRLAGPALEVSRLTGDGATKTALALRLEVLDALLLPQRRRLAAAALEQTKLEVGTAILDVATETRRALVEYQAATELARRLAEAETVEKTAADYAQSLRDAGNLGALEVANARATWAERHAERTEADLEARRARERVTLLLGLGADAPAWSAEPLADLPASEPEASGLEDAALSRRLDVRAASFAIDALAHAVELKRHTRFLPIDLSVGVERERETDGVRLTGPSLALRLPLFDTGKASLARLDAELRQARWQLVARRQAALSEVRAARAALAAARERVEFCRDTLLPERAAALDLTLRSYNMMLVGAPGVLLAKQAELDAERRRVSALRDYWIARAELEHAAAGPLGGPAHKEDR